MSMNAQNILRSQNAQLHSKRYTAYLYFLALGHEARKDVLVKGVTSTDPELIVSSSFEDRFGVLWFKWDKIIEDDVKRRGTGFTIEVLTEYLSNSIHGTRGLVNQWSPIFMALILNAHEEEGVIGKMVEWSGFSEVHLIKLLEDDVEKKEGKLVESSSKLEAVKTSVQFLEAQISELEKKLKATPPLGKKSIKMELDVKRNEMKWLKKAESTTESEVKIATTGKEKAVRTRRLSITDAKASLPSFLKPSPQ